MNHVLSQGGKVGVDIKTQEGLANEFNPQTPSQEELTSTEARPEEQRGRLPRTSCTSALDRKTELRLLTDDLCLEGYRVF